MRQRQRNGRFTKNKAAENDGFGWLQGSQVQSELRKKSRVPPSYEDESKLDLISILVPPYILYHSKAVAT